MMALGAYFSWRGYFEDRQLRPHSDAKKKENENPPSGNTVLLKQIAMVKKSVLAGKIGFITDLHTQLANTRWRSVGNPGEILHFSATQMNDKWQYAIVDNNTVTVRWNDTSDVTFVLDKDGRTFLINNKPDMTLITDTDKK